MASAEANGIRLEYELAGPEEAPVLLMIHGLGAQLIRWPQALCDRFVDAGFRILRYDSRDIGLSSYMDDGRAYTLSDLAADAAGLLDALNIPSAHVLGVSLGGMVAQVLAIEHPNRVRSLAIFMSQSGNPDAPPATADASVILGTPAPDPAKDREAYLRHQVRLNRVLGSPDYPAPEEELRAFATLAAERAWNPQGPVRQMAALRSAPDRRPALRQLNVPTLVVHGADDPLILPECGEDIAANIKGAWLVKVQGMGHDLPRELFGLFVATMTANCDRAGTVGA